VRRFRERLPEATLLNLYGSSEVSADATFFDTSEPFEGASVPIGRPLWNTRIYILDTALQPVPIGVPGEVYVGGDGVARGYWNRPGLTAQRFLPDTFSEAAGAKLYRTGDLARYRPDGSIEYLGRKDHQVKIRGQRVELGEVETALRTHPEIREAAATLRAHTPGDNRIVAYFVPSGERAPSPRALRTHLASKLPDYMVPSAFVPLAAFPRTPSGKIDRRRLPSPGEGRLDLDKDYVAPETDTEQKLVKIWERALRVQPVGVTDNFFELGGHSLLAVRLFAQIEKAFGGRIPLATIFRAPTVRELAAVLEEGNWSGLWASLVPIQPRGSRNPFYCIHAVGGNVLTYADVARHLGPDQPVYGLQAQGLDGKALPHVSIEDMGTHYAREIRAFQPEGPYHLGGSSFGGLVAFEVAQQLHAQGQKVGVLALFDTWGPDYLQHMPSKRDPYIRMVRLVERLDLHLGNFLAAEGGRAKLDYVKTKMKRVRRRIAFIAERSARKWEKRLLPRALRKVESTGMRAREVYVPRPYPGKITLFRASKQPAGVAPDPHLGWGPLALGGVDVYEVPGYHGAIVYEPRARILSEQLADALRKSESEDSTLDENGLRGAESLPDNGRASTA
jgi:thioesterase domain-containing protein/acyl carrier protein